MQEYTINLRSNGTAAVARSKWNEDHSLKAMEEKPFLFEVGQKVVDIFSNVVTIKEIIKNPPLKPGCCPEWNLLVEENGNCYRHTEIAGIFVRELTADEVASHIKNPAPSTMTKKEWYDTVEAESKRVDCCVISGERDSFTIELWYAYDDGSKSPKVAYRFNDIGEMQQLANYLIGLAKEAKQED